MSATITITASTRIVPPRAGALLCAHQRASKHAYSNRLEPSSKTAELRFRTDAVSIRDVPSATITASDDTILSESDRKCSLDGAYG